jgi:hypothetical protein
MQTLTQGYRGLSLLVDLNLDRFLMVGALVAALIVGGMIGSL